MIVKVINKGFIVIDTNVCVIFTSCCEGTLWIKNGHDRPETFSNFKIQLK